jgi:hypothetical protein
MTPIITGPRNGEQAKPARRGVGFLLSPGSRPARISCPRPSSTAPSSPAPCRRPSSCRLRPRRPWTSRRRPVFGRPGPSGRAGPRVGRDPPMTRLGITLSPRGNEIDATAPRPPNYSAILAPVVRPDLRTRSDQVGFTTGSIRRLRCGDPPRYQLHQDADRPGPPALDRATAPRDHVRPRWAGPSCRGVRRGRIAEHPRAHTDHRRRAAGGSARARLLVVVAEGCEIVGYRIADPRGLN